MIIFDGKVHAALLDEHIKKKIVSNKPKGKLLIVLVGDDPASVKYVGLKIKLCESLGVGVKLEHIPESLDDEKVFQTVKEAFEDSEVSGGIIQLPLPRKSLEKLLDLIPTHKDVDLLSSTSITQYYHGDFSRLTPVVRAFCYFALTTLYGEKYATDVYASYPHSEALLRQCLKNKRVYIIGDGILVGNPVSRFLKDFEVTISSNNKYHTGHKIDSDFLILGSGNPRLVVGSDLSAGCHVLDFGTNFENGKVVGDLDKNSLLDHLGTVALSPGGIGPVVVRFLVLNFLELPTSS